MTEASYLVETRTAYDTVAVDYAEQLRDELATRPWERAVLAAFAELVLAAGSGPSSSAGPAGPAGPVVEVGCGPGRVAAHLHELGLQVSGIDLSPAMVAVARTTYPHLRFDEGSMTALDFDDGALSGVVAWYSIIHTPPEQLPQVFAELARVLAPGGHLLLAFQVGDERVHIQEAYGHTLSAHAYRLPPDRIAELLAAAGLAVQARLVREPEPPEKLPQAFLLARLVAGPAEVISR